MYNKVPSLANLAKIECASQLNLGCDVAGYLAVKKVAKRKLEKVYENEEENSCVDGDLDDITAKISKLKVRKTFRKHSRFATNTSNRPKTSLGPLTMMDLHEKMSYLKIQGLIPAEKSDFEKSCRARSKSGNKAMDLIGSAGSQVVDEIGDIDRVVTDEKKHVLTPNSPVIVTAPESAPGFPFQGAVGACSSAGKSLCTLPTLGGGTAPSQAKLTSPDLAQDSPSQDAVGACSSIGESLCTLPTLGSGTAPSNAVALTTPEKSHDSPSQPTIGACSSRGGSSVSLLSSNDTQESSMTSTDSSTCSQENQRLFSVFSRTKKPLSLQKPSLKRKKSTTKSRKPLPIKSVQKQALLLDFFAPGCSQETRMERHNSA